MWLIVRCMMSSEINEQNKMNIKQKNLEKVKNFLCEKKKPLLEDEFYSDAFTIAAPIKK